MKRSSGLPGPTRNRTVARTMAPLALMALIFSLSSQQAVGSELPEWTRAVAHFSEYALLAALWSWALVPAIGLRGLALAAAISLLYALSDEYHQSFVEGRDSDPLDVVTDALGIAVAVAMIRSRARVGRVG